MPGAVSAPYVPGVMAGEDKTEAPTPKRLADARKKGQLPLSRELGTAFGLLTLFAVLAASGPMLLATYKALLTDGLHVAGRPEDLTISGLFAHVTNLSVRAAVLVALPVLSVGAVGITIGLLQTRFNFAVEALKPDIKKLNPIQGIKRIFGMRGLFEIVK